MLRGCAAPVLAVQNPIPLAIDSDGNRYRLRSPASETGAGGSQAELWMRTEPPDQPHERLWTPTLVPGLGASTTKEGETYYDRMDLALW